MAVPKGHADDALKEDSGMVIEGYSDRKRKLEKRNKQKRQLTIAEIAEQMIEEDLDEVEELLSGGDRSRSERAAISSIASSLIEDSPVPKRSSNRVVELPLQHHVWQQVPASSSKDGVQPPSYHLPSMDDHPSRPPTGLV